LLFFPVVVGARETVVRTADELLSVLQAGNALRHTGTTGMNEHSSRSHAILSLQLSRGRRGDGDWGWESP
jgi:kinesin family protein 4/21/27